MKNLKIVLIAAIIFAGLTSCTTANYSDLVVTTKDLSGEVLGNFEITVKVTEFLGSPGGANLLNITADAMKEPVKQAIKAEIANKGGDAAINVEIIQKAEVLDMILAGITGSIYSPSTVMVTGTVIKYE